MNHLVREELLQVLFVWAVSKHTFHHLQEVCSLDPKLGEVLLILGVVDQHEQGSFMSFVEFIVEATPRGDAAILSLDFM